MLIYIWNYFWTPYFVSLVCVSVLFSHSVVSNFLWSHGLQHARMLHPSPLPRAFSSSCPLSQWCHPTILSSVVPLSSWFQSFLGSGSFPVSWLFTSVAPSIGDSVSVLPINIQGWFPLGLTDLISLLSKGLSRISSKTTVQKHQFFSDQLSLLSSSHIHTWLRGKPQLWLYEPLLQSNVSAFQYTV